MKYLYDTNPYINEDTSNTFRIISEIKSLIHKYYSSPIIYFQNNDIKYEWKFIFEKSNLWYIKRDYKQILICI